MLTVTFRKDTPAHMNGEWQWHIGGQRVNLRSDIVQDVISCQADNDELEWISEHFPCFQTYEIRVVTFYGDIARTIAANL